MTFHPVTRRINKRNRLQERGWADCHTLDKLIYSLLPEIGKAAQAVKSIGYIWVRYTAAIFGHCKGLSTVKFLLIEAVMPSLVSGRFTIDEIRVRSDLEAVHGRNAPLVEANPDGS